jgi:predicted transcriptional regulator
MLYTKEQFTTGQSQDFVEEMLDGSLLKFIAAFYGNKKPTAQQANDLKKTIDDFERRGNNNG